MRSETNQVEWPDVAHEDRKTNMIKKLINGTIRKLGYELIRVPHPISNPENISVPRYDKIHYACGRNYLPGWLNTDIIAQGPENYKYVNLIAPHPFPDNFFRYAFCEDFIEHVNQASSLLFLVEAYRTLKSGGVLRITMPFLENVLVKHYRKNDYKSFEIGELEAYSQHGHIHFYTKDSLQTALHHIGFKVDFVESGISSHPDLHGLNTRNDIVNVHAELTKL